MNLINGDCIEEMNSLVPHSIDLIATDLPYGVTKNSWDNIIPLDKLWESFWKVLKPTGKIVLTASQPFCSMLISSQPKYFKYDLIWSKNKSSGFLNAKKQPLRSHESILVFAKKSGTYNPQMTDGHKAGNYAKHKKNGTNYGIAGESVYGGSTLRYPKSVLEFPVVNNDNPDRFHPTQKPVELMEWIVSSYSDENDTVLDCTMGSGTTGIACKNLNRRFIGIEKDEFYFDAAKKRLDLLEK